MTGNENGPTVGIDRDGQPAKVPLELEDEVNGFSSDLRRYWGNNQNAQPRHGKSNLVSSILLQQLMRQGRLDDRPWRDETYLSSQDETPPQDG